MTVLLDNYDSFTYILRDYFAQLGKACDVIRNDDTSLKELIALEPEMIILSPGPETPSKAGIMMDVIAHFHDKIPVLGICLGHQGIGEFFGATLSGAGKIMHGKTSLIHHQHHPLFNKIPSPFEAMRYHSLILKNMEGTGLQIIATTSEDEVMAIVHPEYKICGIQFHPESVLTPFGIDILKNWLQWTSMTV